MLKYRGLLIDCQHVKGCDRRGVIRRAEQAIDKLIAERRRLRDRRLVARRKLAESLNRVLSGRETVNSLYTEALAPGQRSREIKALIAAAQAGARLNLQGHG